jgi:hypothetical protein
MPPPPPLSGASGPTASGLAAGASCSGRTLRAAPPLSTTKAATSYSCGRHPSGTAGGVAGAAAARFWRAAAESQRRRGHATRAEETQQPAGAAVSLSSCQTWMSCAGKWLVQKTDVLFCCNAHYV